MYQSQATKMTKKEIMDYYSASECFKLTEDMVPDDGGIVIGNIDLPITTRCSLKCMHCSSLIPMYECPKDFDLEMIINEVRAFLNCVDLVVRVNVLGGEPMLFPALDKVIELLNEDSKVVHVVLTTNGTVIPKNNNVYKALQNPKNEVRISAYEKYSLSADRLVAKLKSMQIYYTIKKFGAEDFQWFDFGDFSPRNRTENEYKSQYSACDVEWRSLINGKLFPCPRAAHADDMGLIPDSKDNYVDLLSDSTDLEEKKSQLISFLHKEYFDACRFCDRGTDKCVEVAVAEQIK